MSYNANETVSDVRAGELPTCERAESLGTKRRRLVLEVLSERTPPIELDELAAEVSAREGEFDAPPEEAIVDVAIELHHIHLPKLDEAGRIDYNPEIRTVDSLIESTTPAKRNAPTRGLDGGTSAFGVDLRKYVMAYFDAADSETASLDDLARYAATLLPNDTEVQAERIRLWLHHAVLPKLANTDSIEYNHETTIVSYCKDA